MAIEEARLFTTLLRSVEVRKVDFKRDQYLLSNDHLKSEFVKDVLCIANAPGDDGYILIGVKADKGKPREVVGITAHCDSAYLEAIVNGVIEEPIQLEYYPVVFKGKKCGLLHVPPSKARPHWPKRDYGVLRKHVFYTRRASSNREASFQEIREMFLSTVRVSDVAVKKARTSPHIVDELADLSLDDRADAMRSMFKSVARSLGLTKYVQLCNPISNVKLCTLVSSTGRRVVRDYAVFLYPWTAGRLEIRSARRTTVPRLKGSKEWPAIETRLKKSTLVHVCYKSINTKASEAKAYNDYGFWFANQWKETWGKVMKWEDDCLDANGQWSKRAKCEFFLPDVFSQAELKDRFEKLLTWVDTNLVDSSQ
jgi:hypothetical protein